MNRRAFLLASTAMIGAAPAAVLPEFPARAFFATAPGKTYYVSPSGSGSGNGLSPSTPWTLAQANAGVYWSDDQLLFLGGGTFTGGISFGAANWSAISPPASGSPLTIGTYGNGAATFNSGAASGFASTNIAGFVLQNLIFTGNGSNAVHGVFVLNTLPHNRQLNYVQLIGLTVTGYGQNGIFIDGEGALGEYPGFSNVLISGCIANNNAYANFVATCGILVTSNSGYEYGATTPAHTNILVTGCSTNGNTGNTSATSNWSGSGILVSEASNSVIQYCTASNNGANSNISSGGPIGIWAADCINITIQFCEAWLTKTQTGDGTGIGLDGGSFNCIVQYCYSHDNYGRGFYIYSYAYETLTTNNNNTIRFCVSQNNSTFITNKGELMIGSDGATQTNVYVYNNTLYNNISSSGGILLIEGTSAASITGRVCNNIFYSGSSGPPMINQVTSANPTGLLFNGNSYYSAGTLSIHWNGSTYSTVAAWRAAFQTQETIGSYAAGNGTALISNPLLTTPGGAPTGGQVNGYQPANLSAYVLQSNSPMIGAGINLSTQFSISPGSKDYFGTGIPNGSGTGYNVGAYGGTA